MMMRTMLKTTAALAALALAPLPLAAQETATETEETVEADPNGDELAAQVLAGLTGMFTAEPLSAEQETRLPLAEKIVLKIMPEGAMAEMMDNMFAELLNPMMSLGATPASTTVANAIGVTAFEVDLTEDQSKEIARIFDPSFEQRNQRQMELMPSLLSDMLSVMEPSMRKAMSELYAINFTASELAEIDTFFSTETGAAFARKSYTMASDPRLAAASMESLPLLMESMAGLENAVAESTADLPEVRDFASLSDDEKARVAEATGYSIEEIEGNIAANNFDWDAEDGEDPYDNPDAEDAYDGYEEAVQEPAS